MWEGNELQRLERWEGSELERWKDDELVGEVGKVGP